MKSRYFMLFMGLALAAPATASVVPSGTDLPALVEKTLPGVVNISSVTVLQTLPFGWQDFSNFWGIPRERRQTSLGSGFLIDKEGFIITNDHVIEGADEVNVTLLDKRTFRAKIIGADRKLDLALLQIRDQKRKVPSDLQPVPTGDSSAVRIAQTVFAVGNPFGLQHTVTVGIVSAKNRTIGQGPFDDFLQTDASINPGNSGGPLFNLNGEVVGINTMIFSRTGQSGGVGFAIPVNEAMRILPDLKRYGRVPRPWLGIFGETMSEALKGYYNLPVDRGVLIYKLISRAPADRGGLKAGDIIVAAGDQAVDEPNALERALAKLRPTDSVTLKVRRGARELSVKLKLEELPRTDRIPRGIL